MSLRRLASFAALAAIAAANPAAADPAPEKTLSDAALIAYAATSYDKTAMMMQHVALGRHHGVRVVADFPCSDLCPAYTTRIIHYDLAPGPACDAAGGKTQMREVPFSIAVREEAFCIPSVLADPR